MYRLLYIMTDSLENWLRGKYKQNLTNPKFNQITSASIQSINDSDKNGSINAIKEQVATIKENSTSVKSNNQRREKSKNQISRAKPEKKSNIEIIGDSMVNGIYGRGVHEDEEISRRIID